MSNVVVIVGAGPTGLLLAGELASAGVRTVVVERLPGPRPEAPGVAINSRSVEILDQRGLMDPLRRYAITFPLAHFALLPLNLASLTESPADSALVSQHNLERVLAERAVALGVDIRWGHELVGLDRDRDWDPDRDPDRHGVGVRVRSSHGFEEFDCRFLVGCDGAGSTVRRLAGIGFPVFEPPFRGLVGDIEAQLADLPPEQVGAHYSPTGGHFMTVPVGPGLVRVITAEFDGPNLDGGPATVDELRLVARSLTGTDLDVGEPRWLARYGNPTGVADHYRVGNVFLAGEAAHVHFPLNGLPVSMGLEDALNLGWKLAAAVHGWAPPDLLDSYQRERRPAGARACRNVHAQVVLSRRAEDVGGLRELFAEMIQLDPVNSLLVDVVTGVETCYPSGHPGRDGEAPPDPLLGRRFPPGPLRTVAGQTSVAGVLRAGRGVLFDFSGGATALDGLDGWTGRIDVVSAEPVPRVPAGLVLLRPDGYVAWTDLAGTGAEDLMLAARTWFGEPGAPTAPTAPAVNSSGAGQG